MLTRLPPPARRGPAAVARVLARNFPDSRFLGVEVTGRLFGDLKRRGIAGGSVYDALVGAAAAEHEAVLVTRDRGRWTRTALDVEVQLLG